MSDTVTTIAGRYRLSAELGRGGMGVVWAAYDELLRREVAVKELRYPPGVSPADRERLAERTLREARAVAAIDTPAAVRVFDIVEQDGRPWIVMELVRGRSLSELVAERGSLSSAEAARVGLTLLEALETAHRAGVVHRDVKPSNVIVSDDGRVALTDFGIATVDGDGGDTTTGVVVGSPAYLAPERARGEAPTPAADYWSLGATLWTAVEGREPYAAPTSVAVLTRIATEEPPRCDRCTGALGDLLGRLMAADPAARPGPPEVRAALEAVRRDARARSVRPAAAAYPGDPTAAVSAAAVSGSGSSALATGTPGTTAIPVPVQRRRRPPTWLPLAALAVVLVAVAAVVAAVMGQGGSAGAGTGASRHHPTTSPRAKSVASAVPAGWHRFSDAALGWSVDVPPGWQRTESGGVVRFTDPDGGRYFEVSTRYPAAASAVGAWRAQQSAFASTHSAYSLVRLARVSVPHSRDAADWEFTYVDQGAALHAVDHAVVVGRRGYAVFFQTHADRWASSATVRDTVLRTFRG